VAELLCVRPKLASFGRKDNYGYYQADPGQLAQCAEGHRPKTSESKGRTRFNALVHGLRAESAIIPGEDQAEFD
jgi:hypothetical protein